MSAPPPLTPNAVAWEAAEREFRLGRTRLGLALGSVLMPGGVALDWTFYPQSLWSLAISRFAVSAFLLAAWAALRGRDPGRWTYAISFVVLAVPAIAIASMIGQTDGAASNYFLGLILLMVVAQLMGYGLVEAIAFCGLTVASYAIAVFAVSGAAKLDIERLVLTLFFLGTTASVSVLLCHGNVLSRRRDFLAEWALDLKNRELDEKNQQLEELDRLRAAFFAGVSHELRTPLTLILAPLDQLLSRRAAVSEQVGQELAVVRRNAERLRALVDDLLDIVRLDNAVLKLDVEPTDAREFATQIAAAFRPLVNDRGLRLTASFATQPAVVRVDPERMERVFFNLLTNAVKFSPTGGEIRFELAVDGKSAVFAVQDAGRGIPAVEHEHIFERFYQASNNRLRSSQGLGLGLALAREIVRQSGGDLTLDATPNVGARFVVTLPLAPDAANLPSSPRTETEIAAAIPRASAVAEVQTNGSIDVLVVDDEHDLRRFLVEAIAADAPVYGVSSASDGVDAADRLTPAVIVLDFMLPDFDGLEALRRIRANERLSDTRVIMLTAQSDESVKLKALERGADDFLPKPFGLAELRARVAAMLRSARLQRELRAEREALARSLRELQAAEAKLLQSEKMRSIGTLAAGLLHEINNPIHIASMSVKALRKDLERGRDPALEISTIDSTLNRIGTIVSDLRGFAHPETQHVRDDFPIREAIEMALRFAGAEVREFAVEVILPENDAFVVHAGKSQIVQVLVNLLSNAVKAMRRVNDGRAGRIAIEAKRGHDDRVEISVSDNGVGIPAADLSRLTEPFFTTSEPGQGLGLGLSICHSLIQSHGGALRFASEHGQGAVVTFDLPTPLHEGTRHEDRVEEADPVRG